MRHVAALIPGSIRPVLDDWWAWKPLLSVLSGGREVAHQREDDGIESGDAGEQPPGQIELGRCYFRADLAVQLRPDKFELVAKPLFNGLDIGLRGYSAGDAGMDGQRDGLGLLLLEAGVAQALNFGDCVERCLDHVGSLFVLLTEIDHSRPDCQWQDLPVQGVPTLDY